MFAYYVLVFNKCPKIFKSRKLVRVINKCVMIMCYVHTYFILNHSKQDLSIQVPVMGHTFIFWTVYYSFQIHSTCYVINVPLQEAPAVSWFYHTEYRKGGICFNHTFEVIAADECVITDKYVRPAF